MNIMGIDNGFTGAIAILTNIPVVWDAPILTIKKGKKNKKLYDINEIVKILKSLPIDLCILEHAQAYPGQGAVSNFSTGNGFGMYKGILATLKIPYEIIHPKKWQKEFSISKDTKNQAYVIASKLFPNMELKGKKGGIKDGRCDALLIAEYGRRHNEL